MFMPIEGGMVARFLNMIAMIVYKWWHYNGITTMLYMLIYQK